MQQQFVSVTEARANLKYLVDTVMAGKTRVVLVRESKPEVALVRYDDLVNQEVMSEKEWQKEWDKLLREGKKAGKRWAKENGIDLKKATEEQLYELIDKI
jgi:prevent-host-death family protein